MSTGLPNIAAPGQVPHHPDGPRLIADIGGTNARFALEYAPNCFHGIKVYSADDFPGIVEAIQHFYREMGVKRVAHAAIAIANPIAGDVIQMTNHNWRFSIAATQCSLGLDELHMLNDFEALAAAVPRLSEGERRQLGVGAPVENTVIGLVGPGTGLGVAGLFPVSGRYVTLASEGGHVTFGPASEREERVLAYAQRRWKHVSVERVASGPGIGLIYQALGGGTSDDVPPETAEVVELARAGDTVACEAIEVFCDIFGGFAGDVALTFCARGGVFIGGGVVPKLGDLFDIERFRRRFTEKGRFDNYLAGIPTYLITTKNPALTGAAAILSERLEGSATHAKASVAAS